MADLKNYADFNTVTFQGRIAAAEIVSQKSMDLTASDFLSVTVMSNLSGDSPVTVTFNNSNGLKALFEKGFLPKGRLVTIVGRIKSVSETYLDRKSGQTLLRKYPNIHLEQASIPTGGLGPIPASAKIQRSAAGTVVTQSVATVDETPSIDEQVDDEVGTSPNSSAVAELVRPNQAPVEEKELEDALF